MISSEHRLNMCKLGIECDRRIKVCDYEIKNKFAGQTYYFVKQLLEEDFAKNQYDFSLIIGQDNANTFEKWVEYELLEKMIRFVVVPRKGISFDPKISWYLKSPHIYLHEESPIMEISSSEVRKALIEDNHTLLQNALDLKVLEYIKTNKLYTT